MSETSSSEGPIRFEVVRTQRRHLLQALAGGFGLLVLRPGDALGRSLLTAPVAAAPAALVPVTKSITETSSFTYSYTSDGSTHPWTNTNSLPGSGTHSYTNTVQLGGTYSLSYTKTFPGPQTITVCQTTSKSEVPTHARTYTVSYEGTAASLTQSWGSGSFTYTVDKTLSATYTTQARVPWPGKSEPDEIEALAAAGVPVLGCVDPELSVLDPRTRHGIPKDLPL